MEDTRVLIDIYHILMYALKGSSLLQKNVTKKEKAAMYRFRLGWKVFCQTVSCKKWRTRNEDPMREMYNYR